jgi:hypothetical protein
MRKANRLLRGHPDGIFINPFEIGAIGPDLFRAACVMGLEGLVSKHSDRPYRGGRSPRWIKRSDKVGGHIRMDHRLSRASSSGDHLLLVFSGTAIHPNP